MSDAIKHECGIAMVRLLKPLEFYKEKYGSAFYGINKMYLLMEKQHNRGQDGAGFASYEGQRFIHFNKSNILRNNNVKSIAKAKDGSYLFATEEGITRYYYDTQNLSNILKADGNIEVKKDIDTRSYFGKAVIYLIS